jgi:RluA family pseudouridine synthase
VSDQLEELVIHQDADLLVINKPAGLLTLPDGYQTDAAHLRKLLEPHFGRLWIVHRLDKETSGVLLLARNPDAHRSLNMQFDGKQIHKRYHALVTGNPSWQEKYVEAPLRVNGDRRHRTVVNLARGKPSATGFHVIERFGAFTLLEATPQTGRRHQIRAHLASIHHPLVGDELYAATPAKSSAKAASTKPAGALPIARLALHAFSIQFTHPGTQMVVTYQALYPTDLLTALDRLRRRPAQ